MEEALKIGWLCNYTYYPHIVKLTDQEMEKYKELSIQLLRMGLFDKKQVLLEVHLKLRKSSLKEKNHSQSIQ